MTQRNIAITLWNQIINRKRTQRLVQLCPFSSGTPSKLGEDRPNFTTTARIAADADYSKAARFLREWADALEKPEE